MACETRDLGEELGHSKSVPEYIQGAICVAALLFFVVAWRTEVAEVSALLVSTVVGAVALYFIVHRIPALCSSLTIYERGLEIEMQGRSAAFAYDELNCMAGKFTHHKVNHQYIGTRVRVEFFVDGQQMPYVYQGEFRRHRQGERLVSEALEKCSQAIERRLLAELEQKGQVRWRDNASLTADGIVLSDSANASRLIPYHDIIEWKIVDNNLKIWKAGDALPCLVLGNDTPNFAPLCGLFESLSKATRNIDPTCPTEPTLFAGV